MTHSVTQHLCACTVCGDRREAPGLLIRGHEAGGATPHRGDVGAAPSCPRRPTAASPEFPEWSGRRPGTRSCQMQAEPPLREPLPENKVLFSAV